MPKRNTIPTEIVIDRQEIIDDLLDAIKQSTDNRIKIPGEKYKIRLNKRSIKIIYNMLEEIIANYLNIHSDELENDDDGDYSNKILIRPFGFLRLECYDSYEKEAINHLTGEPYTKPHTRHFYAYISKYWRRKWNEICAFNYHPFQNEIMYNRKLYLQALETEDWPLYRRTLEWRSKNLIGRNRGPGGWRRRKY